jgi:hypothetical protein
MELRVIRLATRFSITIIHHYFSSPLFVTPSNKKGPGSIN